MPQNKINHLKFQILETKLKMSLPSDIAPALTDGVVLCHLANHIRPRSVGSIHVPSPAVVSSNAFYATSIFLKLSLSFSRNSRWLAAEETWTTSLKRAGKSALTR